MGTIYSVPECDAGRFLLLHPPSIQMQLMQLNGPKKTWVLESEVRSKDLRIHRLFSHFFQGGAGTGNLRSHLHPSIYRLGKSRGRLVKKKHCWVLGQSLWLFIISWNLEHQPVFASGLQSPISSGLKKKLRPIPPPFCEEKNPSVSSHPDSFQEGLLMEIGDL